MRVLVTGACGFVMSVFLRTLLGTDPDAEVDAADRNEPDPLWHRYVAGVDDRVRVHRLDVCDAGAVRELVAASAPDIVVHGATVTHAADRERVDPLPFVDVNIRGTAHVLDAARRTPSVRRCLLVSSGAVYGAGSPDLPEPQPEDTPLRPDETYGISKLAGELIATRFGRLYGLEVPIVRLTKVFGPMERPTGVRTAMSVPYHLARAVVSGRRVRMSERSRAAGGDWVGVGDVASALRALCTADHAPTGPVNVATGRWIRVTELVAAFGAHVRWVSDDPDVDLDPLLRHGKDGSYAPDRARDVLGWRPRPLEEQVAEYLSWARRFPDVFAQP